MRTYTIEVCYSGYESYDVEAEDEFDAENKAIDLARRDFTTRNIEVTDVECTYDPDDVEEVEEDAGPIWFSLGGSISSPMEVTG